MAENGAAKPCWGITPTEQSALDPVLTQALRRASPGLVASVHGVVAGGKRLRPSVTIAAAGQRGRDIYSVEVLEVAAAVELLHCATLVHDDVMDDAPSRHGQVTINARDGLAQAILSGDMLIAASVMVAAQAGPDAAGLIAETLSRLCVGQALEDSRRFDAGTTEADAMAVARGKTGSLLGAACRLGAMVAGHDAATADALEAFGFGFGTCLQLVDDVLDLTSTVELLGKPVLADFAAGTISLPAVVTLSDCAELQSLVHAGLTAAQQHRAAQLIRERGGVAYTVRQAVAEARAAQAALAAVAGPHDGLDALSRWPRLYLDAQLTTKTDPRLGPLSAVGKRPSRRGEPRPSLDMAQA